MANLLIVLISIASLSVPTLSRTDVLEIKPIYKQLLLKIGVAQELICSVNTTGNSKLIWTLPKPGRVARRDESSVANTNLILRSSLTLENFSAENAGEYECQLLRNNIEISSASIILKSVAEIKIQPTFVLGSKVVALSCDISYEGHSTEPALSWMKNNVDVSQRADSDRFTILEVNNSLIIANPTREDAGLYHAKFLFPDYSHPYDCEVEYTAGPLVLDFEKSKNVIEGDELQIHCIIKGYPYAVVTWTRNGNVINDSRIKLKDFDNHRNALLYTKRVQFSDAGTYTCMAFSPRFPNATNSKFITVRVKDKLAALWPFLGIVVEVVLLCIVILIYEKRRSKQMQQEENAVREIDGTNAEKKEGLRHRNTNNPTV